MTYVMDEAKKQQLALCPRDILAIAENHNRKVVLISLKDGSDQYYLVCTTFAGKTIEVNFDINYHSAYKSFEQTKILLRLF